MGLRALLEYETEPEQLAQELVAERHLIDLLELRWSRKAAALAQTKH